MIQLTVAGDAESAARTTAERIVAAIDEARAQRGVAHVSLAGGRTPARTYELLGRMVHDWRDVHLWLGDERCVPRDDPDSNYALVVDTLLSHPHDPPPTVHAWPGAHEDPAAAAEAYERELRRLLPGDPPQLDLALLGLGEDGHTASLFPDDPILDERERLCAPVHGTKPPFDRLTMTLPLLRAARRAIVLAGGAGKAWAVSQMQAGPSHRIPASLLDIDGLEVELILDHDAAPA
jgi:6-phosphogluconolactonase